ncbi:hypothetical protein ACIHCX_03540 [Streptomyces sp. NPDC052043]|uniref:hypothetical protein n=1 Tax=Streptomyces sp. NPDC052043 TaxID=3365684 RepID=UPI0037D7C7BA
MTVAFEVLRPWPRIDAYGTRQAARNGVRWQFRRHHDTVIAGRAIHWPSLVTVWHRDPSGYDDKTCPIYPGNTWRFHVHHWRLQVHPLQQLRRRLLTRCEICGGRSTREHRISLRRSFVTNAPWWRGETGLAHMDCAGVQLASANNEEAS